MQYFVVAINYPRRINGAGVAERASCKAVVDPDISRSEVISRIQSGEYKDISFIHLITMNDVPEDVTEELIAEAELQDAPLSPVDRQAAAWDRARALRNEAL